MYTRSISDVIAALKKADSRSMGHMPLEGMYIENYATQIDESYDLFQAFDILDGILGQIHKYPNVSIFEALIKKCIEAEKFNDYALDLYLIANKVGAVSMTMHTSMIIGAIECGKLFIAESACQNAIKQINANKCEVEVHEMIDNLVNFGAPVAIEKAKKIYQASGIQPQISIDKNGKVKLDFHALELGSIGFNRGSTYIALLDWVEKEKVKAAKENRKFSLVGITLDHGRGWNSSKFDKNGHHPVKAGVYYFFTEMQKIYEVPYTPHPDNPGLVTIDIRPRLPQTKIYNHYVFYSPPINHAVQLPNQEWDCTYYYNPY